MENNTIQYPFYEQFTQQLKKYAEKEHIGVIYHHLFSFLSDKDINREVENTYDIYKGKSEHYDVDSWFYAWHKSVRQTDYFDGIHGYREVNLLTKEQEVELSSLREEMKLLKESVIVKLVRDEDNYEAHEKSYKTLYATQEYKNLFEKINKLVKIRKSQEDIELSGKMDSILWNTVNMDSKNVLFEIFLRTFSEIDIQEKLHPKTK